MKKSVFIILLYLLVNSLAFSMGVSYINVSEYSNDKSIEIENIGDFENLIKNNKVNSIYRYGSMEDKTISQNIKLLLVTDNAWYVFNSAGYQTLVDYQNGFKLGFDYGPDYYFCVEHEIDNFKEYSNLNQHLFLTVLDYSDAVDLGITEFFEGQLLSEIKEKFPNLYPSPSINEVHRSIATSSESLSQNGDESVIELKFLLPEEMGKEKYDKWLVRADKWFTYMPGKPLRISFSSIVNPEYPKIVDHPVSDEKGSSHVQSILQKYSFNDGIYRINKNHETIIINKRNLGVLYYLMKTEGYTDLEEYLLLNAVRRNGYINIEDYNESISNGFTSSSTYYIAKKNGFKLYSDYKRAREMKFDIYNEYLGYKPIILEFEKIMETYSIGESHYIILMKVLEELELNRTVSLSRILNTYNDFAAKYPQLSKTKFYNRRMNLDAVINFFNRFPSKIEMIGEYNKRDQEFIRKY